MRIIVAVYVNDYLVYIKLLLNICRLSKRKFKKPLYGRQVSNLVAILLIVCYTIIDFRLTYEETFMKNFLTLIAKRSTSLEIKGESLRKPRIHRVNLLIAIAAKELE